MDEVVKLVSQKTGLGEDKAKLAVETVIGFLKNKLPAPLAGQIESALSGQGIADKLGGLASGLGSAAGKQ